MQAQPEQVLSTPWMLFQTTTTFYSLMVPSQLNRISHSFLLPFDNELFQAFKYFTLPSAPLSQKKLFELNLNINKKPYFFSF
jgi:hypothetical protein